jgi:hypothetical protein
MERIPYANDGTVITLPRFFAPDPRNYSYREENRMVVARLGLSQVNGPTALRHAITGDVNIYNIL